MSNEALLKQLTALFSESGCSEFEFEGAGFSLKLKRELEGGTVGMPLVVSSPANVGISQTSRSPSAVADIKPASDGRLKTVKSGITGLFFRASATGKAPFVNLGDKIEAGQTLCLVEAMKMLNGIDSEYSGTIVEILQQDGAEVSAGTSLFVIEVTDV